MQSGEELFFIYSFTSNDNHLSRFCIQIDNSYISPVTDKIFLIKKELSGQFYDIYLYSCNILNTSKNLKIILNSQIGCTYSTDKISLSNTYYHFLFDVHFVKVEGKAKSLPKSFHLSIEEQFEIFLNYIVSSQKWNKNKNKLIQDLIISLIGGYGSIEGSYNFYYYLFSEILNFDSFHIILFLNKQNFKEIANKSKSKLTFDKKKLEQSLENFLNKNTNLQAFFKDNRNVINVFDAYVIYYYLKNDLQKCKQYIEHFHRRIGTTEIATER